MITTIVIALGLFTFLVLSHELGHLLVAKFFKLKIEEFGLGFPPRLIAKRRGETIISFNFIPFGGFVKIYGEGPVKIEAKDYNRSFQSLSPWKRAAIVLAGIFVNFAVGYLALSAIFLVGIPENVFVSQVMPGTPAEISGLRAGDELTNFKKANDFLSFLSSQEGQEISLNVLRDGTSMVFKATPRVNPPSGQGRLGLIVGEGGIPKENLWAASKDGAKLTWQTTQMIFRALADLFLGLFKADLNSLNNVTGPIGVFTVLGTATHLGPAYVLQLFGLISLNLAVLNFLPIPALDGGRLLFILIEKLRGRPVRYQFEAVAHTLGFIVLILLMTIITVRDIIRIL